MIRAARGLLIGGMAIVALCVAAVEAPAQAPACGGPGAPPCPLQGWMRKNVAAPLSSKDSARLADSLDRSAKLSPDASWTQWATIATKGAAAARAGDMAAVRSSCTGCHDAFRQQYKAKYRTRPVPP